MMRLKISDSGLEVKNLQYDLFSKESAEFLDIIDHLK